MPSKISEPHSFTIYPTRYLLYIWDQEWKTCSVIVYFLCGTLTYEHCRSFGTCNFCHTEHNHSRQQSHVCPQCGSTGWLTLPRNHNQHNTIFLVGTGVSSSWIWWDSRFLEITRISMMATAYAYCSCECWYRFLFLYGIHIMDSRSL